MSNYEESLFDDRIVATIIPRKCQKMMRFRCSQIINIIPYHDILHSCKELIDLDTYFINNPDDELCTISAHDLISN